MHFDLTDEQKAIRETVENLLRDKLEGRSGLAAFDAGTLDPSLWRLLMELGLGSIMLPESGGGLGLDLLTLAVTAESLARFAAIGPVTSNALAAWAIHASGDERLRGRWCSSLASGHALAAFALLENATGWLPEDWRLSPPGLSGIKQCVEWAAKSDILIVGLSGGFFGLVETRGLGVEVIEFESLDRSRPLAEVRFTDAAVTSLGNGDLAKRIVDALLVLYAADACGAGMKAYEMAVEYAKVRVQFGQPIGKFQAVKHQLANLAVDIEPCRSLYWHAVHVWDTSANDCARVAAMAKAHVTDMALKTARMAVELHGGIGYTWEYPLHMFLKRVMASRAAMGLPSLHRERAATLAGW